MRITELNPVMMAAGWRNWIFVEVHTSDGIAGIGEATLRSREQAVLGALADLSRHVVGRDPLEREDLWNCLYGDIAWRGGPVLTTAISAIDQALWDIAGKVLGTPVWRLLGARNRPLKAYANGWALDARTPDDCRRGLDAVLPLGYAAFKFDPFGKAGPGLSRQELRNAVALVDAVRATIGPDADLLIEMHGRFNPAAALAAARELAPFGCGWIEEPTPPENPEGLRRVAAASPIPVAAGERLYTRYQFREILRADGVDVAQPDLCHAGGITECSKIAAFAETWQIGLAPHNTSGPVGTAAALHLAAACPIFVMQESFPADFALWSEIAPQHARFEKGFFHLAETPGLGVSLEAGAMARHPAQMKDRFHRK